MGNKKQYRECEECGAPIDSNNPSTRLCKRCEVAKRQQGGTKYRSKDQKKRKRKSKEEEFFEDYYEDS